MNRKDAFNIVDPVYALNRLLPKDVAFDKEDIVKEFFKWNRTIRIGRKDFPVEHGVLIIVLVITVKFTKGDFNDVYLRRVFESLNDKKIYKTTQALDYMDKLIEQEEKNKRNNKRVSSGEPPWLDDIMSDLKDKWNV